MGTARFGLTTGAPLSDHDKQLIDYVLAAFEVHDHTGGERLADPTGPLTGTLDATGGVLASGTTYFYVTSYIDRFGLETAASAEVALTTPGGLTPPVAPTVTLSSGGTLGRGTTYYALSAVDSSGNETVLSTPTLVSVSDLNTAVLESQDFLAGVVSYNVWRQGARSTGFTKIGVITDPTVNFVDDGSVPDDPCACDPTNLPPSTNSTNATSSILLEIASADQDLLASGDILSWRIYRATASGSYGTNSLLAEVTTTVNSDGSGGVVASYTDTGTTALLAGAPIAQSETLKPTVLIQGGGGAGGYVQNPLLIDPSGQNIYLVDVQHDLLCTTQASDQPYAAIGTAYPIGSGPCFQVPSAVYRLGVLADGVLTMTTTTVDTDHDQVFAYGHGPRIVAVGGSMYDLTADASGHLLVSDAV